ncbi:hypothetical protein T492DRAFT_916485 [Pavlovales sp. CCMP2436]|nr:hypothetical protein T492DRAFT_916485 [Pavlovales sp. CCMP2436]
MPPSANLLPEMAPKRASKRKVADTPVEEKDEDTVVADAPAAAGVDVVETEPLKILMQIRAQMGDMAEQLNRISTRVESLDNRVERIEREANREPAVKKDD